MGTKLMKIKDIEKQFGPLTFANLLKAHREAEEFSQVEMAKLLQLSKQALNDIENGRKTPSISRAIGLAKKLGILPELAVELVLQDQIRREKLKMTVKVSPNKKAA